MTGPNNDKFVVIEQGLDVGDWISMAPRTVLDQVDLPALRHRRRFATGRHESGRKPPERGRPANRSEQDVGERAARRHRPQ